MKLLQVCNLGQITGGTAACAWTVARSLPELDHQIVFRGSLSAETRERFREWNPVQWERMSSADVRRCGADLILLHNISQGFVTESLGCPTIQYLHSRITPARADLSVCCSVWLRDQYRRPEWQVLRQAVPRPERPSAVSFQRGGGDRLVVGRLCTPTSRKWWEGICDFYAGLARECPHVDWEFVGCPTRLQSSMSKACRGNVAFHPAGWEARRLLWTWDAMLYHHPTLTESFGRTVGDALRAGCIPIVDQRGGFIEQLRRGPGMLCADEEDFLPALVRLSDPELRRCESARCRRWGEEHYSLQQFGRELLRLFLSVVDRPVTQAAR